MASKNVIKLAERIQKEFGITVDPENYVTTHAGKHLKSGGTYTWFFFGNNGIVGGFAPMKDYLIKKNQLEINKHEDLDEYEIDVIKPDDHGYKK